jgi:hypothetical protein
MANISGSSLPLDEVDADDSCWRMLALSDKFRTVDCND